MVEGTDVKIIDSEFAFYGPIGFDIGSYFSHLFVVYLVKKENKEFSEYLLE